MKEHVEKIWKMKYEQYMYVSGRRKKRMITDDSTSEDEDKWSVANAPFVVTRHKSINF